MMMALLFLSMHRHPCRHQADDIALVTMALLPLIRNGIVALVAMTLLRSLSWHHCPPCNGIVIIINEQASLPSLQWHFVLVSMALLPLMHKCLCCCCNGDCHLHCNGISAVIKLA